MGSSFMGLSTAISGLYANKKALDTVGHNVSNMNTKGYTRQQVNHASNSYDKTPAGELGTGVHVSEIRQIRDQFLDVKYREQAEQSGYYTARSSVFEQVQEIFNEVGGNGIQDVSAGFWNQWDELSKNPENLTNRALLKQNAQAYIDTVNHVNSQLDDLQRNLNKNIEQAVDRINEISSELASMNEKIIKEEVNYGGANDFRDRRNLLLDELSTLVPIEVNEVSSGAVNVTVGGKHLVQTIFSSKMMAIPKKSSYVDVCWDEFENLSDNPNVNLDVGNGKSGMLKGLIDARGHVDSTIMGKGNGSINNDVDLRFIGDKTQLTKAQGAKMDELQNGVKSELEDYQLNPTMSQDSTKTFNTIGELKEYIDSGAFSNKEGHQKLILMTNGTIDIGTNASVKHEKLAELGALGVSVSIIGDVNDRNLLDIAEATGGKVFDINKMDEANFLRSLASETNGSASKEMGDVGDFTEVIPSMKQKLNAYVNTLARNINYLHEKGYDLEGNKGESFFTRTKGELPLQAGNIQINTKFNEANGLNLIAASDTLEERGNGKIAEEINELREKHLFSDLTSDGYYRDMTSEMGVKAKQAVSMRDNFYSLQGQADNKRQRISGVSMDEEMSLMMKYQHSFTANSRMVNVIDQMLDKLINGTGRVGL